MAPLGASRLSRAGGSQLHSEALTSVLSQLSETLKEENASLEAKKSDDHRRFMERKNQILRELIVLQRTGPQSISEAFNTEELRALILRNISLLETNIEAMREITEVLKSAALDAEADGTYSHSIRFQDNAS